MVVEYVEKIDTGMSKKSTWLCFSTKNEVKKTLKSPKTHQIKKERKERSKEKK